MNLVVAMTIFFVAVKAYRNFGGGLAEHCKCSNEGALDFQMYFFKQFFLQCQPACSWSNEI